MTERVETETEADAAAPTSSRGRPTARRGRVFVWGVIAVALPVVYLLVWPWVVLFAVASFPSLNARNPQSKLLEWSAYPAIQLAEHVEFYGNYFWEVLAPLGG